VEADIDMCKRHVRGGEAINARQEEIIRERCARGDDASDSKNLIALPFPSAKRFMSVSRACRLTLLVAAAKSASP